VTAPVYDRIGAGYATRRRADPRITAQILAALGDARSVVNIGAGTGSYEPADREVTAVEPSPTMIAQRPRGAAPAVRAEAAALPFADRSFDAAMAVLTLHHWPDWRAGVAEMQRVARRRVVILTWSPRAAEALWAFDYLPELRGPDDARFPTFEALSAALGGARVEPVPIPHDCVDGFLGAYWRRPRAYLDPEVRAAISVFHLGVDVAPGLARLAAELDDGTWARRYGHLLERDAVDLGYRLMVAETR